MKLRNILVGCGVLLVLCAVVSGIAFVVIGPSVSKLATTVTQGPYQIGARPIPADSNQDTLLPPTVGDFQRGDVQTLNNMFTTTYTSGSTTVNASASAYDSMASAQAAIQALKAKGGPGSQFNLVGFDPSYSADDITSPTNLSYSHGKFFFAFNSASKLDPFMSKFPY